MSAPDPSTSIATVDAELALHELSGVRALPTGLRGVQCGQLRTTDSRHCARDRSLLAVPVVREGLQRAVVAAVADLVGRGDDPLVQQLDRLRIRKVQVAVLHHRGSGLVAGRLISGVADRRPQSQPGTGNTGKQGADIDPGRNVGRVAAPWRTPPIRNDMTCTLLPLVVLQRQVGPSALNTGPPREEICNERR